MENKKIYEVSERQVASLIEEMIDVLNERNERRKEYLEADENEINFRRALSNICSEKLVEALAIKKSLEVLFNFKITINLSDNTLVTSIIVDGKTFEI